jgi:hypothetical protein
MVYIECVEASMHDYPFRRKIGASTHELRNLDK